MIRITTDKKIKEMLEAQRKLIEDNNELTRRMTRLHAYKEAYAYLRDTIFHDLEELKKDHWDKNRFTKVIRACNQLVDKCIDAYIKTYETSNGKILVKKKAGRPKKVVK